MSKEWGKGASPSMERLEPEMFHRSDTRKRLVDRVRTALFPYKIAKSIDQFVYDVSVMAYVKIVKKAASKTELRKTDLSRKQLARILDILQFFYERDTVRDVPSDLIKYFGHAPTFADACDYFDTNIKGEHAFGPGYKFMLTTTAGTSCARMTTGIPSANSITCHPVASACPGSWTPSSGRVTPTSPSKALAARNS